MRPRQTLHVGPDAAVDSAARVRQGRDRRRDARWQQRALTLLVIIALVCGVAALHAAARVVAPLLLSVLCALLLRRR